MSTINRSYLQMWIKCENGLPQWKVSRVARDWKSGSCGQGRRTNVHADYRGDHEYFTDARSSRFPLWRRHQLRASAARRAAWSGRGQRRQRRYLLSAGPTAANLHCTVTRTAHYMCALPKSAIIAGNGKGRKANRRKTVWCPIFKWEPLSSDKRALEGRTTVQCLRKPKS